MQERRERVSNRLEDLSPGLGDVTPEERISGVVFSSREGAFGFAIQSAVGREEVIAQAETAAKAAGASMKI